ncbi:unnamed protein product [Dovyalis caffra]|uniref:Uncharacterized protein n=1 Tax=Dovyalis caffra TaxID=77055 RepID=A0AAV1R012_9ROSI|nr:unnamed protein product [Dovyalis caffra]
MESQIIGDQKYDMLNRDVVVGTVLPYTENGHHRDAIHPWQQPLGQKDCIKSEDKITGDKDHPMDECCANTLIEAKQFCPLGSYLMYQTRLLRMFLV